MYYGSQVVDKIKKRFTELSFLKRMMTSTFTCRVQYLDDTDPFNIHDFPEPVRPLNFTFLTNVDLISQISGLHSVLKAPHKLEDCTLQLYKYGSPPMFGPYLDIESTIEEQRKDLDEFYKGQKCAVLLRTQLSARVKFIIVSNEFLSFNEYTADRLLTSDGRELRRSLFSLRKIFENDTDIIHDFVNNDGLQCLMKVGSGCTQNFLNYALRAISQLIIYVDGMNGLIKNNDAIQWLYSLCSLEYRQVLKTSLKALIIFVEYADSNANLFIDAVCAVDNKENKKPFCKLMALLEDHEQPDSEIKVLCMTIINRVLASLPDQDTFYDVTDFLEEQGMEKIIESLLSQYGNSSEAMDKNLVVLLQKYEATLKLEDGEVDSPFKDQIKRKTRLKSTTPRQSLRRQFLSESMTDLRHVGKAAAADSILSYKDSESSSMKTVVEENGRSSEQHSSPTVPSVKRKQFPTDHFKTLHNRWETSTVMPGSYLGAANTKSAGLPTNVPTKSGENSSSNVERGRNLQSRCKSELYKSASSKTESLSPHRRYIVGSPVKKQQHSLLKDGTEETAAKVNITTERSYSRNAAKQFSGIGTSGGDITEVSVRVESKDHQGAVSRAKDSLESIKSQSSSQRSFQPTSTRLDNLINETKFDHLISENSLIIREKDFTELLKEDPNLPSKSAAEPAVPLSGSNGIPPPPPPGLNLMNGKVPAPPPPSPLLPTRLSNTLPNHMLMKTSHLPPLPPELNKMDNAKTSSKKTIKLHWKDFTPPGGCLWSQLNPIEVDSATIKSLFELKQSDSKFKRCGEGKKEITVLDTKRSNAINIGLAVLPSPRTIKLAILNMDSNEIKKDGVEKLLAMIPTEEEKVKILEAQKANEGIPLGSAEDFLLLLSSISELEPRLRLWLFAMDYVNIENEIIEPLYELMNGIKELVCNDTFKQVVAIILKIGNILNGTVSHAFQIEYLSKVCEVRDSVNKNSLLFHVALLVAEKFGNTKDMYSEMPSLIRCSKMDFEDVEKKIKKFESDCFASQQYFDVIKTSISNSSVVLNTQKILRSSVVDLQNMKRIYSLLMKRFRSCLFWLGIPESQIPSTKVNTIFKTISEFALEYRTTREKIAQIEEKRRTREERKKTRGKLIIEDSRIKQKIESSSKVAQSDLSGKLLHKFKPTAADNGDTCSELVKHLSNPQLAAFPGLRPRVKNGLRIPSGRASGTETDGFDTGDEILDTLVKSAAIPDKEQRPRKLAKTAHRKSLRRTRTLGLTDEDRRILLGESK